MIRNRVSLVQLIFYVYKHVVQSLFTNESDSRISEQFFDGVRNLIVFAPFFSARFMAIYNTEDNNSIG